MTKAEAVKIAKEKGFPDNLAWMESVERQYDTLPHWFWSPTDRDRAYVDFIKSLLKLESKAHEREKTDLQSTERLALRVPEGIHGK